MTPILIDTSCLLALMDAGSANYTATAAIVRSKKFERIIPGPSLPEVTYLLTRRFGYDATRRFVSLLAREKPYIAQLSSPDYARVATIMTDYADLRLDFADAALMTLAERLNVTHILTLDRRDFRVLRPKHCSHFELLP